jgi:ketosteroid isomerase-like protein
MGEVMHRLGAAINSHDIDTFVALFAPGYRSEQPVHPARAFQGVDQVRENWTAVFAGIPDITAELLAAATTGDGVEMGEWHWQGTHLDGSPFAMRGAVVVGVEDGRISWGRLYMEPVEQEGAGIDEMVRETYRPPEPPQPPAPPERPERPERPAPPERPERPEPPQPPGGA